MRLSLFLRISAVVITIVLFSLLLNAFLNYFNFNTTYKELVRSRYNVVLDDLKQAIEYNLNFGLELSELSHHENIQKMIKDKKIKDETILYLKVFDDKGNILFEINPKKITTQVPAEWKSKQTLTDNKKGWSFSDNKVFVIGLPLVNNFNVKEGVLALGYSKTRVDNTMKDMIVDLTQGVLLMLGFFAFITLVGIYLFSKRVIKGFIHMESSLKEIIAKSAKAKTDRKSDKSNEFEENFIAFHNNTKEVMQKLKEAEQEIKKIDKKEVDNR